MKAIVFSLLLVMLFAGCKKESCDYNECAMVAPQAEVQMVETYLASKGILAMKHCSGMYYRIDQQGSGKAPTACSTVDVAYEGKLTNGVTFDQQTSRTFRLAELIPAWRNGIPRVNAGGTIYLYVPPSLGYGSMANGPIPANSVLIFEIDLLGVH